MKKNGKLQAIFMPKLNDGKDRYTVPTFAEQTIGSEQRSFRIMREAGFPVKHDFHISLKWRLHNSCTSNV